MAADHLAPCVAKASAGMVLEELFWIIPLPTTKEINQPQLVNTFLLGRAHMRE